MILSKIQLGGFGGSLLSDNVMNLRNGELYRKARSLLNCADTESKLYIVLPFFSLVLKNVVNIFASVAVMNN